MPTGTRACLTHAAWRSCPNPRQPLSCHVNKSAGSRPIAAKQLRLLQGCLRRLLLLVRGITVFAEDATHDDADLGLGGFAELPINHHAFADMGNQVARNLRTVPPTLRLRELNCLLNDC